ncbi:MAG: hypothetical protein P0Y50_01150 [Candidatus Brevundimonas colombiensis]|uniref:Uncharacterized protein n=1 Tax=Candidatus Brevundimonas colombiensis TaxID=3121376 RepID=A0AAJ5X117_9CAUL|nr:hypothetical protein [Brevundimonas sp.]WEK40238.1 MAG: hypothetical protein P0Y50_01150 [Brevundimonas sp.]
MSHLTPLESAVMDAMAWQMGDSVPDLAAQAASSSPGLRRNTGAGLYSQFLVDADRRTANPDATGLFGTVHVMVADLPEPVGFQIELRQGRLMALHGQSYGQDTRAIDFSNTPFSEVFTVDDRGQSVLYRPARRAPDPVAPRPKPAARPSVSTQPNPQPQPAARTTPAARPADHALPVSASPPGVADMLSGLSNPSASAAGRLALVYLGAYALAVVFVLFARLALHTGWFFALILAFWALRFIHMPKGRAMMSRLADTLDRQGAFAALKSR